MTRVSEPLPRRAAHDDTAVGPRGIKAALNGRPHRSFYSRAPNRIQKDRMKRISVTLLFLLSLRPCPPRRLPGTGSWFWPIMQTAFAENRNANQTVL